MLIRYFTVILLFLAAGLSACGDEGQDIDREPPVPQDEIGITEQQATPGEITDEEVDKFIEVILRAEVEWTDPERQFSDMEPIIHDVGLSLDRYIEIQNRIEQDPEIRSMIERRLEEKRPDGE